MFTFICTTDHAAIAETLDVPRSKLGTCIDSSASKDYCPDRTKFSNYKPVQHKITTADGCLLSAIGMGDLHIKLPDRSGKTKAVLTLYMHLRWRSHSYPSVDLTKPATLLPLTKGCVS